MEQGSLQTLVSQPVSQFAGHYRLKELGPWKIIIVEKPASQFAGHYRLKELGPWKIIIVENKSVVSSG